MSRSMSKLALILPLALMCSCQMTWRGQGGGVTPEQAARGIKDPTALVREYETESYWRGVRRRMDGRANALGRDLNSIATTVDRQFFNYSPSDPYVNFSSSVGTTDHLLRFATQLFAR